jgi:hypothetical protein
VLVHNISRSDHPLCQFAFFFNTIICSHCDVALVSVPFIVTDEPPNRLFFFFHRGGEGSTRTRVTSRTTCRSPSTVLDQTSNELLDSSIGSPRSLLASVALSCLCPNQPKKKKYNQKNYRSYRGPNENVHRQRV